MIYIFLHSFQSNVQDIEQLVGVGRELKACPYYGVRYAIPAAQVRTYMYMILCFVVTKNRILQIWWVLIYIRNIIADLPS